MNGGENFPGQSSVPPAGRLWVDGPAVVLSDQSNLNIDLY
jgi:hypothetical protein